MLMDDLLKVAGKWLFSAQPFVGHNAQSVLIAAGMWFPLQLFRRGIDHGSLKVALARMEAMGGDGDTEIVDEKCVIGSQQHVVWLDIAMNEVIVMDVG